MSLKDIGKFHDQLKAISKITNLSDGGSDSIYELASVMNRFENLDDVGKVLNMKGVSKDIAESALRMSKFADGTQLIGEGADMVEDWSRATGNLAESTAIADASAGTFKSTLAGIGGSIGSFLTNPATLAVAGITAGIAVITTAFNNSATAYTRAQNSFAERSNAFQTTKSEADALSTTLGTVKSRMEELLALENAGTITLVEQSELNTLRQTSSELERQLTIKKNLLEVQGSSQATAARAASKEEISSTEMISNATGMPTWLVSLQQVVGKIGGTGSPYAGLEAYVKENDTTAEGMLENQIETVTKYKSELDSLYEKRNNAASPKEQDSIQKEIDKTESAYASATQSMSEYSDQIQSWIDASYDANGNIIPESATQVREWKGLLTEVQNMGKTDSQIAENSLNNFFDGSAGKNLIKDELMQAAEAGGNLEDVLARLGLSLSDIGKGVTNDNLTQYFNGLVKSAKEAEEAANSVDGSFEGVQAAQSSKNQGYEWDVMSQNLKKGQELYESGAIGTDDFQTMAQWMAPDKINTDGFQNPAEAYKKAWEETYNTVSGWFNAENPVESMWKFADDLSAKDNDMFKVLNKETGEIIPNFKTTAEAADALGVSVGAVDTILGKMKEYGFEFEGVMFSGEGLDQYKQSLEGIREIANGLEDGSKKEKLLDSLEVWDENYEKYQEDLSLLTEEQVVEIKFEYDLAQIQQNIEDLREKARSTDSTEDWAELNLASKDYRETREEQTGYNEGSDAGYQES